VELTPVDVRDASGNIDGEAIACDDNGVARSDAPAVKREAEDAASRADATGFA
jgi:hypothetical protein